MVHGQFLQPDTIVPNVMDPQSWNRYAYALNNPVRYTDPTGHYSCGDGDDCTPGNVNGTGNGTRIDQPNYDPCALSPSDLGCRGPIPPVNTPTDPGPNADGGIGDEREKTGAGSVGGSAGSDNEEQEQTQEAYGFFLLMIGNVSAGFNSTFPKGICYDIWVKADCLNLSVRTMVGNEGSPVKWTDAGVDWNSMELRFPNLQRVVSGLKTPTITVGESESYQATLTSDIQGGISGNELMQSMGSRYTIRTPVTGRFGDEASVNLSVQSTWRIDRGLQVLAAAAGAYGGATIGQRNWGLGQ